MKMFEKGAQAHTALKKTVLSAQKISKNGTKKINGADLGAVLHNANRIGAGFRMNKRLPINDPVAITLVFADKDGGKGEETLSGRVQWVREFASESTKGFLVGVAWDSVPTKESNPWLHDYLDITLHSS